MITLQQLLDMTDFGQAAQSIGSEDIPQLVDWLSEKDDKIRYHAFLLLQQLSRNSDAVYSYWDVFVKKLSDKNSYQRSLGAMLLSETARWASTERMQAALGPYLNLLQDEKPITIRQCIQSLEKIVCSHPTLAGEIAQRLMDYDIKSQRESMQKLILIDIVHVLVRIRKLVPGDEIDSAITKALTGGLLDKKTVKEFQSLMEQV